MDFSVYYFGSANEVHRTTVNQANVFGWVTIWSNFNPCCDLHVVAWSGVASSGPHMGLDAIRIVRL
jgi:hypothetical protein